MGWPSTGEPATGMLSDLRILDFSTLLPGPYCTQIFADMGADVLKVEQPGGDPARHFPGGMYEIANRNKRSITLNLKDPADQARALALAAEADVVLEGFRPGVAERLGIGYEQIRAVKPDIVYCSISGFGQTGPWRLRPGHDLTYLATSGGLAFSPHWHGKPRRSGIPIADLSASTFAAISILAALRDRDRGNAGGAWLDVAISDTTLAFAAPRGGLGVRLSDADRVSVYPHNDLFETADGETIAVSAVEKKFWDQLRRALSDYVPELADTRFDEAEGRLRHGDLLSDLLARAFLQKEAQYWVALFEKLDVPVERTLPIAEAARTEHSAARGLLATCEGDEQIVFPVHCNGSVIGRYRRRAPGLGRMLKP